MVARLGLADFVGFVFRLSLYGAVFAVLTSCGASVRVSKPVGTSPPPSASAPAHAQSSKATKQRGRFSYPLPYAVEERLPVVQPVAAVPRRALAAPRNFNPAGRSAAAQGVVVGPAWTDLRIAPSAAAAALQAFRTSCPTLLRRTDRSGLTRNQDWQSACRAADSWPTARASDFFARHMRAVQVGNGKAHATGYYEPEIRASRTRRAGYEVPIYRRPPELSAALQRTKKGAGKLSRKQRRALRNIPLPYYSRSAIERGALHGRGLEIAYAADPVDFFFLQIQGSGRLRFPDGTSQRIGYAGSNGHRYVGIGSLLRKRGQLRRIGGSMQSLKSYIRANPKRGAALMRENPSWIFFREINGAGPIGAIGVPVVGKVSVAADPAYIPLGAPVVLSMNRRALNGLWIAQDTGSAIKGANRVDSFWGTGAQAGAMAGGISARGTALVLLPRRSAVRLVGQAAVDSDLPRKARATKRDSQAEATETTDDNARQAMQKAISQQLEEMDTSESSESNQ